SVHRMRPRWTQWPAGAVMPRRRCADLSNLGDQWPDYRGAGAEPGSTRGRLSVSRGGQLQVGPGAEPPTDSTLVTNRVSAASISDDSVSSSDNGVGHFTVSVVARSPCPTLWKCRRTRSRSI